MALLTPRRFLVALLTPAAVGLLLSGCSLLPGGAPDEPKAEVSDELLSRFVTCLTTQHGQTARIGQHGRVEVLIAGPDDGTDVTEMSGASGDASGFSIVSEDEQGTWLSSDTADGYEDATIRDAWNACEDEVPGFEQPNADISGGDVQMHSVEDQLESSLAFADCARENGYADFADPDENGMLSFPAGMTEEGFRELLTDCFETLDGGALALSSGSSSGLDFDWMAVLGEFEGGYGVEITPIDPEDEG